MYTRQPLRAAFGVTHTDSLYLLQLEQNAWQDLPSSLATMHTASGPTRPAREIAITARRTAAADPANYDQGAPTTPTRQAWHPAATATLAAATIGTLTFLSLTRPALAAGLAIVTASVAARIAWRHRARTHQNAVEQTDAERDQ